MKTPVLTLTLLILSTNAFAVSQPEGTFASRTATWYFAESREACLKSGGKPMGEDDEGGQKEEVKADEEEPMPVECVIPVDDTATVTRENGELKLAITTWGSNTHSCNYEGKATLAGNVLTSEERIDDSEDGKPRFCKVTVKYLDENTVTVDADAEACRWFCGARAWGLGIEKALRTDPKDVK